MTNIHSFESHERARFNKFRFRVLDQLKTVCTIEITCLKDLTDFENYKGKNCYYHLIKFKYEERVLYDDRINSVSCFFVRKSHHCKGIKIKLVETNIGRRGSWFLEALS